MNIREATKSYEEWMRRCTRVVESDSAIEARANERGHAVTGTRFFRESDEDSIAFNRAHLVAHFLELAVDSGA
jgi:hypothetical protein